MHKNLRQMGLGIIGFLLGTLTCGAITFTNDAAISFSNTNFEGQELVVSNCVLTIDGAHTFAKLHILSNGVVRHSSAQNGMVQEIITVVDESHTFGETNSVTLLRGGVNTSTIVVTDPTGFVIYTNFVDYFVTTSAPFIISRTAQSSIPEGGTILVDYQSTGVLAPAGMLLTITNNLEIEVGGAIHLVGSGYGGGFGPGAGLSRSTNTPLAYTNGGGGGHGGYGGIGALGIRGGTSYGSVTNPADLGSGGGTGNAQGGAGGGAARIIVGNLLRVDGVISADGERGTNSHSGGGSGGSLFISTKEWSGNGWVSANGGNGEPSNGGGGGGGRIAVYYNTSSFSGDTVARGGGGWVAGGAGSVYTKSSGAVAQLTLDNRGLTGTNSAYVAFTNVYDLTIKGGANLNITNAHVRHLFIGSNSWIIAPTVSLILTVDGSATLQPNGGINANGKGLQLGGGAGQSTLTGSGAGYGGNGGRGSSNSSAGATHGSMSAPVDLGSGGGTSTGSGGGLGGLGGGAVKLTILGALSHDGEILANGSNGPNPASGGGSGGSIFITAASVAGAGKISANGGVGFLPGGGGGGGGRIALYYATNVFTGKISASGAAGWENGGPGTVYLKADNKQFPELLMDNGGLVGATTIGVSGVDWTISGGAVISNNLTSPFLNNFIIGSNSLYKPNVNSSLTVTGNLVIEASGAVSVDGMGASFSTGFGQTSSGIGGGGGHGGAGGRGGTNALGGISHGSTTAPNTQGGFGGSGSGSDTIAAMGGPGGGVMRMTIGKDLVNNGTLSSRGVGGRGANSGGGAGGTIHLTVGRLIGSGIITAQGGPGDLPFGGGGGGGRIAIYYGTNLFSGTLNARGGQGFNYGSAGTVYLKANNNSTGTVISENGGNSGTYTLVDSAGTFDLTVGSGATVAVSGSSTTLRELVVKTNGVITLATNNQGTTITLSISANATIEAGGSIHLDGRNTSVSQGFGSGNCTQSSTFGNTGSGGGNGGHGGTSVSGAVGGISVGLITTPTTSGGTGGFCSGGQVVAGGGHIRLTITSNLTVNGKLSVNGNNGLTPGTGGAAGGSVWINTGKLLGTGVISANGGAGESPYGGGGGGGRIAVYFSSNLFTGTLTAYGGPGFNHGGAGTIFLKASNKAAAEVIIANNSAVGAAITPHPGLSLHDLTIGDGAIVSATTGTHAYNNLFIRSNAWLTISDNTSPAFTLNSNAVIERHGGINLASKGYVAGSGSAGLGSNGGGSGHGGNGGGLGGTSLGGRTYGGITNPTEWGSGASSSPSPGARGGGALRLNWAQRNLHLDGEITVNGGNALTNNGGGAAGGSVWLTLGRLSGTGTISAHGGAGSGVNGCGGGGGRIALYLNTNHFVGTLSTRGGSGAVAGGAGTVYVKVGTNAGTVLVDNGGLNGATTPLTGWTETGSLAISGGASVQGNYPAQLLQNLVITTNSSFVITNTSVFFNLGILGNAVVDGTLTLDGMGNNNPFGPGAGQFNGSGSGGGHGGAGGMSASGALGGEVYGSATSPNSIGSQGGLPFVSTRYSQGGGAIRMQVNGDLSVNGGITVNGNDAIVDRSGGGAGGSIWISASTLRGDGVISADGGAGEPSDGGGGGGGRIALYARTNHFNGILSAAGGIGWENGGDGTLQVSSIPAPAVVSVSAFGEMPTAISSVFFTFDSYLNFASASVSDFIINTPSGPVDATVVTPSGLSAVQVSFPTQNALGDYSIVVGPHIQNVYGVPMATSHVASFTIVPLVISGTVTETNGLPAAGVPLQLSGGLTNVVTDTNGFYSLSVVPNWGGSVTPAPAEDYVWVPDARHYTNLTMNATNQNFVRLPLDLLTMTNSSTGTNLTLGIYGVNGVSYQPFYSSNLVNWFPYGDPVLGTNALLSVNIPTTNGAQTFFQFRLNK